MESSSHPGEAHNVCMTPLSWERDARARQRQCCLRAQDTRYCWSIAQPYPSEIPNGHFGALNALGEFGERVQAGRREERLYGTADLPNFYRKGSPRVGRSWAVSLPIDSL